MQLELYEPQPSLSIGSSFRTVNQGNSNGSLNLAPAVPLESGKVPSTVIEVAILSKSENAQNGS